jgi:hypothetical protein
MRKKIYLSVVLLLMCAASAVAQVAINKTNFPDSAFRLIVKEKFDADKNDTLSTTELTGAHDFYVYSNRSIKSIKGLEFFPGLINLYIAGNPVSELDLSKNGTLLNVNVFNGSVTSVNLNNDTTLNRLNLMNNPGLTKVDLSSCSNLQNLSLQNCPIKKLDFSKNPKLTGINVENCGCDSIDPSPCPHLTELRCSGDSLSKLDVTGNLELTVLVCNDNNLTDLDVTKNVKLKGLSCDFNHLTNLDVSNDTLLTELYCSSNNLTVLDVTKLTKLTYLKCADNHLTAIDISSMPSVKTFDVSGNTKEVMTNEAGEFDLTTLAQFGFNVAKASGWIDGTVNGNTLTFASTSASATYDYDCGAGQTETFTLIPKVLTGLSTVSGASVKAFASQRVINIVGTDATAHVYDVSGRAVYAGADRQISVASTGLYLVRVAGKTFKVLVH